MEKKVEDQNPERGEVLYTREEMQEIWEAGCSYASNYHAGHATQSDSFKTSIKRMTGKLSHPPAVADQGQEELISAIETEIKRAEELSSAYDRPGATVSALRWVLERIKDTTKTQK